jgi:hypothetical protein
MSKAKRQIGDQTTKGGVIGIMIYALSKNNVDPVLIGLLVPVASSVLAWHQHKNRRPRPSVPIHTKRRRQTKKIDPTLHDYATASCRVTVSRHGHMGAFSVQTL